jgi:hypothetical protein
MVDVLQGAWHGKIKKLDWTRQINRMAFLPAPRPVYFETTNGL